MSEKMQLFENQTIRTVWDEEKEEFYFSVEDVVSVLSESSDPKQYVKRMRSRDSELSANWGTICTPVEMIAKDGKKRKIMAATTEGILRLVQSIPSKNAEQLNGILTNLIEANIDEE